MTTLHNGPKVVQTTLKPLANGLWEDEDGDKLCLDDIHAKYGAVREHWRFEHGLLFVGASDQLYTVVGVPHCGNRYTADMLNAAGYPAEIMHLRVDTDYPKVMPVRDPRKCLLGHWKRKGDTELGEVFFEHFVSLWEKAAKLRDSATVYFVDRDEPQTLFDRLGIDKQAPEASRHAHPVVDVVLNSYPPEVDQIAMDWGYT